MSQDLTTQPNTHLPGLAKLSVPVWEVVLTEPGRAARREVVRGPSMRVGTHADNDLVLGDRTVSRLHAELTPGPDGVRVRDLGSRNGTTVQGVRVTDALAGAGMSVGFGQTSLLITTLSHEAEPLAEARFGGLHGHSPVMRALFARAQKVASTDVPVLIEAESGCGKELLARSMHEQGPRQSGPWVVFDCAAVAPTLIESTLFGHEKGAFTGADAQRSGLIEAAHGGTLFIDELGELPLELQPRLLRFLESGEVRRVGSVHPRQVDVRVVAATHRDLVTMVAQRTFREDLYYRLAVVRLRVPPLRERLDDLESLVRHLVGQTGRAPADVDRTLAKTTPETWAAFRAQPWRGNVRELRNVVERSLAIDPEGPLSLELEPRPALAAVPPGSLPVDETRPFTAQREALLEGFDRAYLSALMVRHEGNFSRAAAAAGVDRMYLKRLLRRYGL